MNESVRSRKRRRRPIKKSPLAGSDDPLAAAANDDGLIWPLIPFPEGWYGA
jgi:hypothetical protein